MINHHPTQVGIWFDYDGGRYKDNYDLRLKTGEVLAGMYPNANAWYPAMDSLVKRRVDDNEVAQVRLKPDDELHEYAFTGQERIDSTLRLFGDAVPPLSEAPK